MDSWVDGIVVCLYCMHFMLLSSACYMFAQLLTMVWDTGVRASDIL